MKIPSQLVELGTALELDCDTFEFTWTLKDTMRLFSNPKGDKLVLMYFPKSKNALKHPKNEKNQDFSQARGLYSRFQGFKSDKTAGFSIVDSKLSRIGSGNYICYRSDKWGKPRIDYKHDFKCSPAVYVDSIYPHIIVVSSSKLRVTRLGIEG